MNMTHPGGAADSILAFLRTRVAAPSSVLDHQTRLLDGGMIDSLGVLDLMEALATEYRFEVMDDDFVPEHFETVGTLAQFVERKLGGG